MAVGPKPELATLAAALNPTSLRLFVRDLLTEMGFRDLRDFDGVGDGGRDLEGVNPAGDRCVVQLKYREEQDATTSTDEFAELPKALLRLGRRHGVFITNGRLTAPAKRDASNAFPGFTIEFFEGIDLLDALDRAPITYALWIDGVAIRDIRRQAVFGIVCRSFPDDRSAFVDQLMPLIPVPNWDDTVGKGAVTAVTVARGPLEYPDIDPFRPPRVMTMSEGWMNSLIASRVILRGPWSLGQVPSMQQTIARHLAQQWAKRPGGPETCAIRVARPTLSPEGSTNGVPLDIPAVTWTCRRGSDALDEQEAIRESLRPWSPPSWIQQYQAMCGLYYLLWSDRDLLCSLRYRTYTSRLQLGQALADRARFDYWWERSICILAEQPVSTDEEVSDALAPHFCERFGEMGWIVVWLHPRQHGGLTEPAPFGDERDGAYNPLNETESEQHYLESVRARVASLPCRPMRPIDAYHALCFATGGDAAPSVMWRRYDTGTLLAYANEIPSPIDFYEIRSSYAAVYEFDSKASAVAASQACSQLSSGGWTCKAEHSPERERHLGGFPSLAGKVDRSIDERIVLFTFDNAVERRAHLAERLSQDSGALVELLANAEASGVLLRGVRASRKWLRLRWRVYFEPEHPAPGDDQILLVPRTE